LSTSETILEGRQLRKEFGGLVAVADVSLSVARSSLHSIIGPNGAGKTTLFNLITGRYTPTGGTVILKGQDITALPPYRRAHLGLGRSYQITNVFPNLTVLENVRLAAQAMSDVNFRFYRHANSYREFIDKAMHILTLIGLEHEAGRLATTLPHGGKRKLELAILLASDPDILLLDEPTAGMASEQVPELIATIDTVRHQGDKTIVMVEHNMSVVMGISDRITVMHQGWVLAEGAPAEIMSNTTVQQAYLGELYGDFSDVIAGGTHA
jgi:branched-chain amino acid transport system ATP-binding protein